MPNYIFMTEHLGFFSRCVRFFFGVEKINHTNTSITFHTCARKIRTTRGFASPFSSLYCCRPAPQPSDFITIHHIRHQNRRTRKWHARNAEDRHRICDRDRKHGQVARPTCSRNRDASQLAFIIRQTRSGTEKPCTSHFGWCSTTLRVHAIRVGAQAWHQTQTETAFDVAFPFLLCSSTVAGDQKRAHAACAEIPKRTAAPSQ